MAVWCPQIGGKYVVWYGKKYIERCAVVFPLHGVEVVCVGRMTKGKPRNHLVRLPDGRLAIVPAGNLKRLTASEVERVTAAADLPETFGTFA